MARFLHYNVTVFPFPLSVLWKQVTKSSPHSKDREIKLHILKERVSTCIILNSPVRKVCFFSSIYSFSYLLMSQWTHVYLFYVLYYNPILHYFIAQLVASMANGSSVRLAGPCDLWTFSHFSFFEHCIFCYVNVFLSCLKNFMYLFIIDI